MKKLTLCIVLLALSASLWGQAARVDPVPVLTTNQTTGAGYPQVLAIPNASVYICTTNNPPSTCSVPATTYTDATAATPCPTNAPLTPAGTNTCTALSDKQGNIGFWGVAGATVYYTETIKGKQYGPYPITIPVNQSSVRSIPMCSYTVASLPTNLTTGTVCVATDANPDCATGGGTKKASCRWNGSSWDTIGGGGFGSVASGGSYKIPFYPSSPAQSLNPSNITSDATGNNLTVPGTVAVGTTNPITIGGATGSCSGKVVAADGTGCVAAGNVNGQAITPSLVTVNNQALGYQTPLARFVSGPLNAKKVMWSGDSTVAITSAKYDSMCFRTSWGGEFQGMACASGGTYAVDTSHNVTITFSGGSIPATCTVGSYVTNSETSTSATNINGSAASPIYQITAATSSTITFNNPNSANSTSGAINGNWTCSFMNNGSNGATQSAFNARSGPGSLAFTNAQAPDLDIHRGMGINDVRGGSTSKAQLIALIKAYIDSVRANSPNTDIIEVVPNSLTTAADGFVSSPSTTSTTAVASTGTCTITLASSLNAVAGLVTPDLTLAQQVANGSAHLIIDDGSHGTQETVPILAINGNVVTATCANTHTAGFTVAPTQATMAQGYSNILHDAVMSFVGYAPNVLVLDTQTYIYGRLVQATTPLMADSLHPNTRGQGIETDFVAEAINKAKQSGGQQAAVQVAGLPTSRISSQTSYSPMLALAAMSSSYAAPWNYYPQAVENPDYFTLVCAGALNNYSSGSYIRISAEINAGVSSSSYGVCPVQQGDVVEFVGYGVVQLGSNAIGTNFLGYTQIYAGVPTIPWTMPVQTAASQVPVRVYRFKYVHPAAEPYAKDPTHYTMRYVAVQQQASGGAFSMASTNASDPNSPSQRDFGFQPTLGDKLVCAGLGDLSSTTGFSTASCSYASGVWYCNGTTGFPSITVGTICQAFYSRNSSGTTPEVLARKVISNAFNSQATNRANTGVANFGNAEKFCWRNQGNTADLCMTLNSSNAFHFDAALDTASLPSSSLTSPIVANVALTNQSASISSTTMFTNSAATHQYTAHLLVVVRTAGTAGTIAGFIQGGNEVTTFSPITTGAQSATASAGTMYDFVHTFTAGASSAIRYGVTLSGVTGSFTYDLYITLEQMQ